MSARKKYSLRLSNQARVDIRDILSFTLQRWGEEQLTVYKDKIDKALALICTNPGIGREWQGRSVYHVGRHQIFYLCDGRSVNVVRILHDGMDTDRHLPPR